MCEKFEQKKNRTFSQVSNGAVPLEIISFATRYNFFVESTQASSNIGQTSLWCLGVFAKLN